MFNKIRYNTIPTRYINGWGKEEDTLMYQNTGQIKWTLFNSRPEFMNEKHMGQLTYDPNIQFPCWIGELEGDDGFTEKIILESEQIAAMYSTLMYEWAKVEIIHNGF